MKIMRAANLDGHDLRRFTELARPVDVDAARIADFERLDWRHKRRLLAAFLRLAAHRRRAVR